MCIPILANNPLLVQASALHTGGGAGSERHPTDPGGHRLVHPLQLLHLLSLQLAIGMHMAAVKAQPCSRSHCYFAVQAAVTSCAGNTCDVCICSEIQYHHTAFCM